jgi:hypothetical protein
MKTVVFIRDVVFWVLTPCSDVEDQNAGVTAQKTATWIFVTVKTSSLEYYVYTLISTDYLTRVFTSEWGFWLYLITV